TTGGNNITLTTGNTLTLSQNLTAGAGNIKLNPSAGGVTQTAGAITGAGLQLAGVGTYTLNQTTNDLTTLAANVTGAISYTDANSLTVGSVTAGFPLTTVNGITSGGNDVTLTVNDLTISNALNAGAGNVTIQQTTGTTVIDLGTNSGGNLGLTNAELALITTSGALRIGNTANSGNIQISSAISNPAGWSTLDLRTGGTVTQTASITTTNLAVQATGAVTLTNASNDVGTLAVSDGGAFSYTDANALTIGTVDGIVGITTAGGGLVTITNGGVLTIAQNITADGGFTQNGAGTVTTSGTRTITTTGDAVSIATAVTLGGNLTIDTTSGSPAGGGITFSSTIDADNASNDRSLTLTAGTAGAVVLGGTVGGNQPLNPLTVTNAGTASLRSVFTTRGGG